MRRLLCSYSRMSDDHENGESDTEDLEQSEVCRACEFVLINVLIAKMN